jgi:Flp pilus assembly pilin Flp
MKFINKMIKFLRDDESGAVTLEYVAVAVIVGALAVSAMTAIKGKVNTEVGRFDISAD